jgi:type I restriction enzyme S subunit
MGQGYRIKRTTNRKKERTEKRINAEAFNRGSRLPGYNEEWEEVRLGDIGQTFNGLSGKSAKDFGEGKPFITYKNIFDNSRVDIEEVDYVEVSENENQNIAKYGDIFFTTSSETPDEVGMSSVLLDEVEELYLNSFCFGYRLYDFETLIPEYARFLFRGKTFRNKIFKLAQGSTRFNISKNEVMKLNIKLPLLQEQKAIAQVLSTADKEIELLEEELEQLKLQKKGLMQLLLTGIIRVK